jgi:hypothetical protein
MRLIIEARLEGGGTSKTEATTVAVVERKDRSVADLGLTLAEGRALLAEVQSLLVSEQTAGWMRANWLAIVVARRWRTRMPGRSWCEPCLARSTCRVRGCGQCNCAAKQGQPRRSVSPLCKAVHQRVTPELEYLQAKWAAHLPYRQATELLREVLPLDKGISFGSTRRRILAIGRALEAQIERDIASGPKAVSAEQVRESTTVGCVSVDSAWLSFSTSPKSRKAARDLAELKSPWAQKLTRDRHVNIVAGRATLTDRTPRL